MRPADLVAEARFALKPKEQKSPEVDAVIERLRQNLADPKLMALPWRYGQCRIDGRVFPDDHIWSIDGKTFARNAVNALPLLIAEIDRLRALETSNV